MTRQNLWIHKMKRLKLINMNRTILQTRLKQPKKLKTATQSIKNPTQN